MIFVKFQYSVFPVLPVLLMIVCWQQNARQPHSALSAALGLPENSTSKYKNFRIKFIKLVYKNIWKSNEILKNLLSSLWLSDSLLVSLLGFSLDSLIRLSFYGPLVESLFC